MEIKGKVHCFFEQSATFRDEFRKLGYESFDYDIQNSFGKTDYQIDLFVEIEKAYDEEESIFNNITKDDLIIAFFPCIYFEAMQANYYQMACNNLYCKDKKEQYSYDIAYEIALKLKENDFFHQCEQCMLETYRIE